MKRRMTVLMTATFLLVAGAARAGDSPLLKLDDNLRAESDPGSSYGVLTGSAVNVSDHELSSAFVTLNLYDAQNNLVGNTAAVGQHIAPGQRWIYRAYATLRYVSTRPAP